MKHTVETQWKGKMTFDALMGGHTVKMDANTDNGGEDKGVRPKELMLAALGGCTGMDVIAILDKMRIVPESFHVRVEAEVTEEHPKHYTEMHLIYEFKGKNLEEEKLQKAIELSQERYCGVLAVYKQVMKISYEIKIIE
jgi:putative redox protein